MRSRRLATSFMLVLGLTTLGSRPASAQSDDQCVGTWKLNLAKSKLGPGRAPRSVISTIESVGGRTKMTGVRIGADGLRTEAEFTAKIDGKDYPIKGSVNAETVSLKRIDSMTIERTDKRAGKVVETSVTVYSADGKSSSTTGKARSLEGESFEYLAIHEKQ